MYIIEVYERKKWRPIKMTLSATKSNLEEEVKELNKLPSKEEMRYLLVKEKYRVRKIKKEEKEALLTKKTPIPVHAEP